MINFLRDREIPILEGWKKLEPKHIKYFNGAVTLICVLMFFILYLQIKKASVIIAEDIKSSTVYVHDTTVVRIQAPRVYQCWNCKKELRFIDNTSDCCNFVYHIVDGKLTGMQKE